MDILGKVRRMRLRDRYTISEIARRTGLARNTIKVWLKADPVKEPRYRRRADKSGKLSAFEATLASCLKADPNFAANSSATLTLQCRVLATGLP